MRSVSFTSAMSSRMKIEKSVEMLNARSAGSLLFSSGILLFTASQTSTTLAPVARRTPIPTQGSRLNLARLRRSSSPSSTTATSIRSSAGTVRVISRSPLRATARASTSNRRPRSFRGIRSSVRSRSTWSAKAASSRPRNTRRRSSRSTSGGTSSPSRTRTSSAGCSCRRRGWACGSRG